MQEKLEEKQMYECLNARGLNKHSLKDVNRELVKTKVFVALLTIHLVVVTLHI